MKYSKKHENAFIYIRSIQRSDDDTDETELSCKGIYLYHPDRIQIIYPELDDDASVSGVTLITVIGDNLVTVQKTGFTESRMVLETGKSHEALYRTMVGTMDMLLSAIDIRSALDADGGTLNLHYLLEISRNDFSTENILELSVRKDPENL